MKRIWGIGISIVAGVVALWIVFTQFSFYDIINSFSAAPLPAVLGFILVNIVIMLLLTWRWQRIMHVQKLKRVPFVHLFAYKIIGYGVSYVTPGVKVGGEAVRANLLQRHKISFHKGLSSIAVDKLLELSTSSVFFIVGAIVAFFLFDLPAGIKWVSFFLIIWLLLVISLLYYQAFVGKPYLQRFFRFCGLHKAKWGRSFERRLKVFERMIIEFHTEHKREFFIACGISFLTFVLMFFEFHLILVMLNITWLSFSELFLIITIVNASYFIPIPMALGVLEAGQLSVFRLLRLKDAAGIALALLTRTKDLVWTLIGFIMLTFYGINVGKSVKEAQSLGKEIDLLEKK
jgi:uncharacterized protein (TIRG00374 family)